MTCLSCFKSFWKVIVLFCHVVSRPFMRWMLSASFKSESQNIACTIFRGMYELRRASLIAHWTDMLLWLPLIMEVIDFPAGCCAGAKEFDRNKVHASFVTAVRLWHQEKAGRSSILHRAAHRCAKHQVALVRGVTLCVQPKFPVPGLPAPWDACTDTWSPEGFECMQSSSSTERSRFSFSSGFLDTNCTQPNFPWSKNTSHFLLSEKRETSLT